MCYGVDPHSELSYWISRFEYRSETRFMKIQSWKRCSKNPWKHAFFVCSPASRIATVGQTTALISHLLCCLELGIDSPCLGAILQNRTRSPCNWELFMLECVQNSLFCLRIKHSKGQHVQVCLSLTFLPRSLTLAFLLIISF